MFFSALKPGNSILRRGSNIKITIKTYADLKLFMRYRNIPDMSTPKRSRPEMVIIEAVLKIETKFVNTISTKFYVFQLEPKGLL